MTLSNIQLAGSAEAIGHGLGVFGREAVLKYLRPLPLWQHLASLAHTPGALQMRDAVRAEFPRYWQEIEGLAAGLQLPVAEVFMWNCRGDYLYSQSVDGCTTVFSPVPGGTLIAHNEDGFPQLRGYCAILEARPDAGLAFTSFVYPGSIPGHTFAVNEWGLVATVNNIRPADIPGGIPRQVLGRATLDATSIDEAIAVVTRKDRAGAFHHAFGQAGSRRLVSVEASAQGCSVTAIEQPAGHSNHLISPSLSRVRQRITASSGARQQCVDQRLQALKADLSADAALSILRDTSGGGLPVYRSAVDDPDDENTLATALFLIGPGAVEWQVHARQTIDRPDAHGIVSIPQ